MTLEECAAHIGHKVIYRPEGQGREAAEEGVITSVNASFAFVRYGSQVTSAATGAPDLELLGGGGTPS